MNDQTVLITVIVISSKRSIASNNLADKMRFTGLSVVNICVVLPILLGPTTEDLTEGPAGGAGDAPGTPSTHLAKKHPVTSERKLLWHQILPNERKKEKKRRERSRFEKGAGETIRVGAGACLMKGCSIPRLEIIYKKFMFTAPGHVTRAGQWEPEVARKAVLPCCKFS